LNLVVLVEVFLQNHNLSRRGPKGGNPQLAATAAVSATGIASIMDRFFPCTDLDVGDPSASQSGQEKVESTANQRSVRTHRTPPREKGHGGQNQNITSLVKFISVHFYPKARKSRCPTTINVLKLCYHNTILLSSPCSVFSVLLN